MGEIKDHLKQLPKLPKKIMALGESISQAEEDMESTWVDQIEARDLRDKVTREDTVH